MEILKMRISDLEPADYNPRVELKEGDPEWAALKGSLEKYGYIVPIVWNRATGRIVSGHQRLNVLKAQGVEEVEVSVIECDEKAEQQLNIAMNKVEGEWDYGKLSDLFAGFDESEITSTGFTEGELTSLFRGSEKVEDAIEDQSDGGQQQKDSSTEPEEESGGDFTVYLSFPSRAQAEQWLREEGIGKSFESTRNININMEGINYGD